jgi:hypothetical protein
MRNVRIVTDDIEEEGDIMAIEQAILARAQPQLVQRKLGALLNSEVSKGCMPELCTAPVRLEPQYAPLFSAVAERTVSPAVPEREMTSGDFVNLRVWVSPDQNCEWTRSELFLKALSAVNRRMFFQIVGHHRSPESQHAPKAAAHVGEGIRMGIACHPQDETTLGVVFRGQFDKCEISRGEPFLSANLFDPSQALSFVDVYPPPPYSHLLTSYDELKSTPFAFLLEYLAAIPPPSVGFYQCVFQPVDAENDWHRNVEGLLDVEYMVKLNNGVSALRQITQQTPSGDLHQMASEVVTKAHNDKPFFCAAVRIGLLGPMAEVETSLAAISAFIRVFQHGGRPLRFLTHRDYERVLPPETIRRMIAYGTTYRPGFLVNSHELTGLVHLFSPGKLNEWRVPFTVLETLPVRNENLQNGTFIGTCEYAGQVMPVCIPDALRALSALLIGASGTGKSTTLINTFYHDVHVRGMGAAIIDIHGDTIKEVMRVIDPRLYDKCIYFNPGDPEWIPLWNPLSAPPQGDVYRHADDIISSLRRVFTDWGDRMEHVLRNGLIGLASLSQNSLLDLYMLTRQGSPESDALRKQIIQRTDDGVVRKFWETDFMKDYRRSDLQSSKHKLSKLVSAGSVSMMLSQSDSRINIRQIMDEQKILLVDLSQLGSDVAEVLGAFMLSQFLTAAMSRSDTEIASRQPFSLFVDEAHRFISADAIENIIVQARKFRVNIVIALQLLSQMGATRRIDALSTVGCTLIGRMDKRDSEYFAKDCQDLVDPVDIMRLNPFEVIAKIGNDIVRVKTAGPRPRVPGDGEKRIKDMSRAAYCRRAADIRAALASRSDRWNEPFSPLSADDGEFSEEDLKYDEF